MSAIGVQARPVPATEPDALDFYRHAAPMTAIDLAAHGHAVAGLSPDAGMLAEAARGVLVHRDWAPAMGLRFAAERLADQHIRPVDAVIARVLELHPDPLRITRQPGDRMVGVCRHFAVLHVALLRHHGIPARARAGFAGYFERGWVDHWITEWWEGRWVRHDAQVGPVARSLLRLGFDPADQPAGRFLTGAEAWRLCRAGDADPADFGIFDLRGLWFVYGNLRRDLAALNQVELLPWDAVGGGPQWEPTAAELDELDEVAETICTDRLARMRDRYLRHPVPRTITSFVDGVPTSVDLGPLVP